MAAEYTHNPSPGESLKPTGWPAWLEPWLLACAGLMVFAVLYAAEQYHYLLFHVIVELFSIVIAFSIFTFAWNCRRFLEDNYLVFLGIAYLFVAGLDTLHLISYEGMGVFTSGGANLATQLWIASRYLESIAVLAAAVLIGRRINPVVTFGVFTVVFAALVASIFWLGVFPECYVQGASLTPFKIYSEYIICGMLAAALGALYWHRAELDETLFWLLAVSIGLTMVAELFFSVYKDVYGVFNALGHFCKVLSFYTLYRAILKSGMTRPFAALFRQQKKVEDELREERSLLEAVLRQMPAGVITVDEENGDIQLCNAQAQHMWRCSGGDEEEFLRGLEDRFFYPDGRPCPPEETPVRRTLRTGESMEWEEFVLQRADGSFGTFLMGTAPVKSGIDNDRVAVCTFADITDRKQMERQLRRVREGLEERVKKRTSELEETNRALRREVERRRRAQSRIQTTNRLLRLFQSEDNLRDYLESVAGLLSDMTGCRNVGVRLRNGDGHIPYMATVGFDQEFSQSECWLDPERHRCICSRVVEGEMLEHEEAAVTRNGSLWANDSRRFWEEVPEDKREFYRARCIEEGFRTLAVVPIRRQDNIIGGLHLADEKPGQLSDDMVKFLESITPFIWEAVHRFRMERRLEEYRKELRSLASQVTKAEEQERRRVAAELHDSVAQTLALSKMKLGALESKMKAEKAEEALREVKEHLDNCIDQTRSLTFDLSPPILYEVGLVPAVEQLADRMREEYGLQINLEDDGDEKPLNTDSRVMLFRSVRELLFNVVKHAEADTVEIYARRQRNKVSIKVSDDGCGFEPSAAGVRMSNNGGFGLFDIRERLNQMGGSFILWSEPGEGTVATVTAPVEED